jgi:hypothetical protein
MQRLRIGHRNRLTISRRQLARCGIREGDAVMLKVVGGKLVLCRIVRPSDDYLKTVESGLTEWNSAEDDKAWRWL